MFSASGIAERKLVSQTFTANTTWTAPATSNLETLVGNGAAGKPGEPGYTDPDTTQYRLERYRQQYTSDGAGGYYQDGGPSLYTTGNWVSSPPDQPDDYCDPPGGASYYCYSYVIGTRTVAGATHPPVPATTGASATGFGKTFPGGTGGAATPVPYNNVAVTPGASYPLVVPSGGSITITYYV